MVPWTPAPKSSSKNQQNELKPKESITSDRKTSTGARFARLDHRPTSLINRGQGDLSSQCLILNWNWTKVLRDLVIIEEKKL